MKKNKLFLSFAFFVVINCQAQIISTIAGNGLQGYTGDGGNSTNASFNIPIGITSDNMGNIYIADKQNDCIRKVNTFSNVITTIAGNGTSGYGGDGKNAINANLNNPVGVTTDVNGNIYIADTDNSRIRKVTNSTGVITTVAGRLLSGGFSGDGGLATSASLRFPSSVAVDKYGNIYIADAGNNRIRKVNASTGIITTIAGNGIQGYSGDSIIATLANLNSPGGIAIDQLGNILIADLGNNRIRKVTVTSGIITTVAGNGIKGYNGDNILATASSLSSPNGVSIDSIGNIYIADGGNNRIRKIEPIKGIITTVAGDGFKSIGGGGRYNGDGGSATSASLNYPSAITIDSIGNIFIADTYNGRIRKVYHSILPISLSYINVLKGNSGIELNWHTEKESRTDHFIIQHSTNGTSFHNISLVNATGSGANSYTFTDYNPNSGKNYYRLQSVDKDGSSSYSKVVRVNFGDNKSFSITPNPARDFATISFSKSIDKATIAVYDITGKAVFTHYLSEPTSYKLNTQALTNGVYVIKVKTDTGSYNEKLLINK